MKDSQLSNQEKIRYSRHLNIPEIGEKGQARLKRSAVMIVGAGGLGSASSLYLAAAGVGKIGIIDSDKIELSNLQRQILHDTQGIGVSKVKSAADRLTSLNPEIEIQTFEQRVTSEIDRNIFTEFPIVIDATDNFETRYLLNEICVAAGKVFIYAAIYQFFGQTSVFHASSGPCFQCVFRTTPSEDYAKANQGIGVVGAVPGVIGSIQAIEAIKQILGIGSPLVGRLLLFNGLEMNFQQISISKNPVCPVCGGKPL